MTIQCEWFLLCQNDAQGTEPHPVLGDVPICNRCRTVVGIPVPKEGQA